MRGTGKALFSGSRFVRWTLMPVIVLCVLVFALDGSAWTAERAGPSAAVVCVCLLLFLAIGWPARFRWAGRILGVVLFLTCAAYLWSELRDVPEGVSWTDTNAWNSAKAMLVFGLPSLWYAVRGRFGLGETDKPKPPAGSDDPLPVLPDREGSDESR